MKTYWKVRLSMIDTSFIKTFPVVNKLLEHAILQSSTPNDVRLDMLRIRDINLGDRENYRGCISPEGYPAAYPILVAHYENAVYVNNIASSVALPKPFEAVKDYNLLLSSKE